MVAASALFGFPVLRVMRTTDPTEQAIFKLALERAARMHEEMRLDLARKIINQLAQNLKVRRR